MSALDVMAQPFLEPAHNYVIHVSGCMGGIRIADYDPTPSTFINSPEIVPMDDGHGGVVFFRDQAAKDAYLHTRSLRMADTYTIIPKPEITEAHQICADTLWGWVSCHPGTVFFYACCIILGLGLAANSDRQLYGGWQPPKSNRRPPLPTIGSAVKKPKKENKK